jgi:hypothetical protein
MFRIIFHVIWGLYWTKILCALNTRLYLSLSCQELNYMKYNYAEFTWKWAYIRDSREHVTVTQIYAAAVSVFYSSLERFRFLLKFSRSLSSVSVSPPSWISSATVASQTGTPRNTFVTNPFMQTYTDTLSFLECPRYLSRFVTRH